MTYSLDQLNTAKAADEGKWLELEHPVSGEPLDMHLKLLGSDSDAYKKTMRKQQDRHLKKGLRKLTSEQVEADSTELIVSCTVDWKNMQENGDDLEFTKENVRRVYKTYDFVREQAREFVEDRSNFLGEF
jgi:hypothetical protein